MAKCEVCGASPAVDPDVMLNRVNEFGVEGRWRCGAHTNVGVFQEEIRRLSRAREFPDIGPDPLDSRELVKPGVEGSRERLTEAYVKQQAGVPDQTALVWRIDLSRVLGYLVWNNALLDNIRSGGVYQETFETITLTRQELDELLEYSSSVPTGTTIGKRWKARYRNRWLMGEYVPHVPNNSKHEPSGALGIFWREIHVEGSPLDFVI